MTTSPEAVSLTPDNVPMMRDIVDAHFPSAIAELGRLVKIPGIAWDAFDANNLQLSAEAVAKLLRDLGIFEVVEIRRAESKPGVLGAPAVIATRAARNGRPTVLLYAHHDVQPPGDDEQWNTPPFQATLIEGRLFGRGAADDKAGIVAHLTALKALAIALDGDIDLGISMFIEGEEEAGSPSFRNFLEENRADLAADLIVVADSANWSVDVPALTTSLRGLVSQVIEVQTLDHSVHSGMFGGAIPDAMTATIKLLATLHDENGDVAVAGLHHAPASGLTYDDATLRTDSGLLDGVSQLGTGDAIDRIWNKPAITVIGIDGQTVALSSNTMLPSVKAKISMRIAPGDSPEQALDALRAHLNANVPWGARLTFGETELGKPHAAPTDTWSHRLASQALTAAWGNESVNIGIGGSIPFIADLVELFPKAQILVTGVEDPDSRAHSPNESLHLETLRRAILAESLVLLEANDILNP
jgi:cysteinylglycine-S-conjugate dipeptidase